MNPVSPPASPHPMYNNTSLRARILCVLCQDVITKTFGFVRADIEPGPRTQEARNIYMREKKKERERD
jgi:hypothetical protein